VSSKDVLARLLTDSGVVNGREFTGRHDLTLKYFDVSEEKRGSRWKTETHTMQKIN